MFALMFGNERKQKLEDLDHGLRQLGDLDRGGRQVVDLERGRR